MIVLEQAITSSGGTFTIYPENFNGTDILIRLYAASPVTLVGDVVVNMATDPIAGTKMRIEWAGGEFDLDVYSFTIPGVGLTQLQLDYPGSYVYDFIDGTGNYHRYENVEFTNVRLLGSQILEDGSVPISKIENLTSAQIIVGNSSNIPTAVAVTGDIAISNAGVTSIASGVIVNADINASAAIALSKLAALTASKVVVTDVSGVITTANQVSPLLGGLGLDASASTGFVKYSAGTASIGSISDVVELQVSFESGYAGDFKIKMPFAGTVTEIYAYAIKAIAGTDNGTIVAKNNGGTTMTNGTITYTASDARGTAYTVSPSANNTFSAGDLLTFTTAKTTAGGVVQLSITVTRTS